MSENDHHVLLVSEEDPENPGKTRKRPVLHGGPRPGTVKVRASSASVAQVNAERDELKRLRAELEAEKRQLEKRAKALEKIEKQRARQAPDTDDEADDDETDN